MGGIAVEVGVEVDVGVGVEVEVKVGVFVRVCVGSGDGVVEDVAVLAGARKGIMLRRFEGIMPRRFAGTIPGAKNGMPAKSRNNNKNTKRIIAKRRLRSRSFCFLRGETNG